MPRSQGVVAIQSDGRVLLDQYGCVILFQDRDHAHFVLSKMGYWTGGFTYLSVFRNNGRYTREWNKLVRERARKERDEGTDSSRGA